MCLKASAIQHLLQGLSSEGRQDERSLVDVRVVVSAQLLLLLLGPRPERHLDVGVGVLAAHHEADLARWVGWDGGVSVLSHREDFLAVLLELGDELQVEPLVLSCENWLAHPHCPFAKERRGLKEMGARGGGGEGRKGAGAKEGTGLGKPPRRLWLGGTRRQWGRRFIDVNRARPARACNLETFCSLSGIEHGP